MQIVTLALREEEEWGGLEEVELWPEGTNWQAVNGDKGGPGPL